MRVSLNRDRCRRCGLCAAICPEIFELDAEHVAYVVGGRVPAIGSIPEYCMYAAEDCPVGAIHVSGKPALQFSAVAPKEWDE